MTYYNEVNDIITSQSSCTAFHNQPHPFQGYYYTTELLKQNHPTTWNWSFTMVTVSSIYTIEVANDTQPITLQWVNWLINMAMKLPITWHYIGLQIWVINSCDHLVNCHSIVSNWTINIQLTYHHAKVQYLQDLAPWRRQKLFATLFQCTQSVPIQDGKVSAK